MAVVAFLKKPRKASPKSLENAAIYYLKKVRLFRGQFKICFDASSAEIRRASRDRCGGGQGLVDDVIFKLQNSGYLDDQQYAETRIHSLVFPWAVSRAIRVKLSEKGVPANIVTKALRVLKSQKTPNCRLRLQQSAT